MECALAIQILPVSKTEAVSDEEVCRIVDEVIAYLQTLPANVFVGPFETTIEGSLDVCMEALRQSQHIAQSAGADKVLTYAKIEYVPDGVTLTTERKVGKYAKSNAKSGLGN